jgi:nitroreductase
MRKTATTAFALHPLIAERWSPRAFAETPPTDAELGALLEAVRWAPSAFNEQPWRLIVTRRGRGDAWQRLFDTLAEGNRVWCARVPVLILSVAVLRRRRDGQPNRTAQHDLGLATAQLILQARALDLVTHAMAGFDRERARVAFAVPEGSEPVAVIAVGRQDRPEVLPEPVRARELAPRERLGLDAIAFADAWGEPLRLEAASQRRGAA